LRKLGHEQEVVWAILALPYEPDQVRVPSQLEENVRFGRHAAVPDLEDGNGCYVRSPAPRQAEGCAVHFFKRANANLRGPVKRLGGSVRRSALDGRQAASLQQLAVRLLPLFNGLAEGVPAKK